MLTDQTSGEATSSTVAAARFRNLWPNHKKAGVTSYEACIGDEVRAKPAGARHAPATSSGAPPPSPDCSPAAKARANRVERGREVLFFNAQAGTFQRNWVSVDSGYHHLYVLKSMVDVNQKFAAIKERVVASARVDIIRDVRIGEAALAGLTTKVRMAFGDLSQANLVTLNFDNTRDQDTPWAAKEPEMTCAMVDLTSGDELRELLEACIACAGGRDEALDYSARLVQSNFRNKPLRSTNTQALLFGLTADDWAAVLDARIGSAALVVLSGSQGEERRVMQAPNPNLPFEDQFGEYSVVDRMRIENAFRESSLLQQFGATVAPAAFQGRMGAFLFNEGMISMVVPKNNEYREACTGVDAMIQARYPKAMAALHGKAGEDALDPVLCAALAVRQRLQLEGRYGDVATEAARFGLGVPQRATLSGAAVHASPSPKLGKYSLRSKSKSHLPDGPSEGDTGSLGSLGSTPNNNGLQDFQRELNTMTPVPGSRESPRPLEMEATALAFTPEDHAHQEHQGATPSQNYAPRDHYAPQDRYSASPSQSAGPSQNNAPRDPYDPYPAAPLPQEGTDRSWEDMSWMDNYLQQRQPDPSQPAPAEPRQPLDMQRVDNTLQQSPLSQQADQSGFKEDPFLSGKDVHQPIGPGSVASHRDPVKSVHERDSAIRNPCEGHNCCMQ